MSVRDWLAIVLAIGGGACGRIGFENRFETDAGAVVGDGRTQGGSLECEELITNCFGATVSVSIGGSSTLGVNLEGFTTPLIPTCGNGPVAEGRARILPPSVPAIISFEVAADIDVMLSIISDDCEGTSLRCTTILANSNGLLEIASQPGEVFILSAASNNSCGDVEIIVRGATQGS